jgi:hypothetical protein
MDATTARIMLRIAALASSVVAAALLVALPATSSNAAGSRATAAAVAPQCSHGDRCGGFNGALCC